MVFNGHQEVLLVVMSYVPATAKLQRLCGQDFSFCGGYAVTKAYSRLDRLHKNANLSGSSISFNSEISGGKSRPIGEFPIFFGSHGSHQKCPKIHAISHSNLFLAILESLDTPKIYS